MSARKPWSMLGVLGISSLLAISFLAALVGVAFAGYLSHRSGPKTIEIIRYVSVASSSPATSAHPPRSAPE